MVVEARIETAITRHAWNGDCTMLAVCPNDNSVVIMKKPADPTGVWERVAVLKEHDALVTDIAWAPKTNRIITTSQDRNAYVWTLQGDEWKPMLVILRITAAATSVQWCATVLDYVFLLGFLSACTYQSSSTAGHPTSKSSQSAAVRRSSRFAIMRRATTFGSVRW